MPEEIMIIIVLGIIAGTVTSLAKIIVGYLQSRSGAPARGEGVTTRELEAVMRRAVEDATQPLLARIDDLEDRLVEQERLPEPARRVSASGVATERP